jgi:hypothetical protein
MKQYVDEVKNGTFPGEEHCYRMIKGEHPKFLEMVKQYKKPE